MIKMKALNENMQAWSFDDIVNGVDDLETAIELAKTKYQRILEYEDFEQVVEITYGKRDTPSREAYEEECEEWLKEILCINV